ncbi:MAG: DNA methyltransferase, partial [Flavobacteriaceae bacterium]|nr:DNA methyltransferase [Flavobacteriaceae bacterium]
MPFYAKDSDVAYIVYMAKRVIEYHRILKPTGSFFYHCDDTMQHDIKVMLDIIFGREHLINEINWRRYQS